MNPVHCVFIFTSHSSMKDSFVVCCLIDFNENHSIVANGDFRKLNSVFLCVWVVGGSEGTRGLRVGGGELGDSSMHHAHESTLPQSPAQIHA